MARRALLHSIFAPLLWVACAASPTPPDSGPSAGLAARSTSPSAQPSATGATLAADVFVRPPGAPDPLACATDADCTHGQTYDASGCCGTFRDMAATAQSKAYLEHATEWRAAHCADHACPSPPVPTEPLACLFQVRCAETRCRNACP